jgi:hypothetical protein
MASSSFQAKEKKHHREEKHVEKGRSFPLSSHFAISLLALASTLSFQPFCFKHCLLASSSFQVKKAKKKP